MNAVDAAFDYLDQAEINYADCFMDITLSTGLTITCKCGRPVNGVIRLHKVRQTPPFNKVTTHPMFVNAQDIIAVQIGYI